MFRIESLLSARLFLKPQIVADRIYFLSNLSGHLSLYAMDAGGSIPEPLLPPDIALQNPHLIEGKSFFVFPDLHQILVMIDHDGDENYQPMLIPLEGGYPEIAFNHYFANQRVHLVHCEPEKNSVFFSSESRDNEYLTGYLGNLKSGELTKLASSPYGAYPDGANADHTKVAIIDTYTVGDNVLYLWEKSTDNRKLIYGVPLEDRSEGQQIPLNSIGSIHFIRQDCGMAFITSLLDDAYSLAYLEFDHPERIQPIAVTGRTHQGVGEMVGFTHLEGKRYLVEYNIDGCSWLYEGILDETVLRLDLNHTLCGQGILSNGVLESVFYDRQGDRFALSFSSAVSPTQIYTIEGKDRGKLTQHTNEKLLGIQAQYLSKGEDASFVSFDGTRVSARLYLPAPELNFVGPRPLVYYVHGGPQGQERPDFAWFSMPLIQFLSLNGLAVFVPNVRGSTGYGLTYTKQVDRDWGGLDVQDHVSAMDKLNNDPRLDTKRAAVVGRSYGGYMTLTLASRYPQFWSAAVDMFGPFDLLTFLDRIPPSWRPYFRIAVGDPETDRDFLVERSPRTYISQIQCPLLVIQGRNDPRVVEKESHDLVDFLHLNGKQVEYLVFENEGHDVLKFENRVTCYNAIMDFFTRTLHP
ncbi:MAG TPA: prolyl oligopeptidase family serine peptidase [Anaerolineaceae bacterium]|nr:prolyl oligopeptidase family serine peptidase [Anaerolineaceae bacterium]